MKLVPKAWDEYSPVLVLMGAGFLVVGTYFGVMISGPPMIWLIRGPVAIFGAIGALILIKQFQQRKLATVIAALVGMFLVGSVLSGSRLLSDLAGIATFGFLGWHWIRDRKSV